MTRSVKWLAVVFVIGGVGGAAFAFRQYTPSRDAARSPARRISIDGTRFTPLEMVVPLGSTVTWTNADPFPHNVDSTAGGFESRDLAPGASWSVEVNRRGVFPYKCTLHPGMNGVLRVE